MKPSLKDIYIDVLKRGYRIRLVPNAVLAKKLNWLCVETLGPYKKKKWEHRCLLTPQ